MHRLANLCKLLGDINRLRILEHLRQEGELHVQALCQRLGQSQPAVSHHLGLLRSGGLVHRRREGKHNFYRASVAAVDTVLDDLFAALRPADECLRTAHYALRPLGSASSKTP